MTPTVYHQLKSDQRIQEINPHIGYTFWLAPNARSAQLHIEKTFGSLTNAGILLAGHHYFPISVFGKLALKTLILLYEFGRVNWLANFRRARPQADHPASRWSLCAGARR
jgi:hypothetical protein